MNVVLDDAEATSVTGLITFVFIGSSLGLLPAGLLADRFGRRPVMWGGLGLYVMGAIGDGPDVGIDVRRPIHLGARPGRGWPRWR